MAELRFLVDENLSFRLAVEMGKVYPGSLHVGDENLSSTSDTIVWDHAKNNAYVILTKDNDFHYLSLINGCPPKVIRLNCGNKSTTYISDLIKKNKKVIMNFYNDDGLCYLEII